MKKIGILVSALALVLLAAMPAFANTDTAAAGTEAATVTPPHSISNVEFAEGSLTTDIVVEDYLLRNGSSNYPNLEHVILITNNSPYWIEALYEDSALDAAGNVLAKDVAGGFGTTGAIEPGGTKCMMIPFNQAGTYETASFNLKLRTREVANASTYMPIWNNLSYSYEETEDQFGFPQMTVYVQNNNTHAVSSIEAWALLFNGAELIECHKLYVNDFSTSAPNSEAYYLSPGQVGSETFDYYYGKVPEYTDVKVYYSTTFTTTDLESYNHAVYYESLNHV